MQQQSAQEVESFRDDAVAIINGSAVTVAVISFWSRPAYMIIIALVVAVIGYFMAPRSKGGTVMAVFILGLISLLFNFQQGYSLV